MVTSAAAVKLETVLRFYCSFIPRLKFDVSRCVAIVTTA
jgi:hypothetical protein